MVVRLAWICTAGALCEPDVSHFFLGRCEPPQNWRSGDASVTEGSHFLLTQANRTITKSREIMEEALRKSARTLALVGEAIGLRNLDPDPGIVFVTGAGVIGHRVALRLLNSGYPRVRLGTGHHKHDDLEELNSLGAELADFSWDREETYEKALKGVKSVFITLPYAKNWHRHFPVFLESCRKAGIKHCVKLSFYHARVSGDPFQSVPLVQEHGDCDELLINMVKPGVEIQPGFAPDMDLGFDFSRPNMSYTILSASHFMSNPFIFQGKELRDTDHLSTFYGASGNRGVNYVSPNDVAEVAVRVLMEPRAHYNKEYTLTGPEAITEQQVADLLSKYLKKPVMYVDQPLREFSTEIKLSGVPHWMVEDLVTLEKIKATGKEEDHSFISNDVEKICGRKAESYEDYLRRTDMMTPMEAGPPDELKPLKPELPA
jgi:uncharacterized protein YbjT (DUF2867 family)